MLSDSPFYDFPTSNIRNLVSRPDLVKEIDSRFNDRATTSKPLYPGQARSSVVVIVGSSGHGKTQFALEYCRKQQEASPSPYYAIFWIDASSTGTLADGFAKLAVKIGVGRQGDGIQDDVAAVVGALEYLDKPWLLVFDNYNQPDQKPDSTSHFPQSSKGKILITTRKEDVIPLVRPLRLTGMAEEQGLALLLGAEYTSTASPAEIDVCRNVLSRLAYFPQALNQARTIMVIGQMNISEFLETYDHDEAQFYKQDPVHPKYHDPSVATFITFEMAIDRLPPRHYSRLEHFLTVLAFFEPSYVSESIFAPTWGPLADYTGISLELEGEEPWNREAFQETVRELESLGLIHTFLPPAAATAELSFSFSPLLVDWMSQRSFIEDWQKCSKLATEILATIITTDPEGLPSETKQLVLPHVDTCLQHLDELGGDYFGQTVEPNAGPLTCQVFQSLAELYGACSRYEQGHRCYRTALYLVEKEYGPKHVNTMNIVSSLAAFHQYEGNSQEALELWKRALAGIEELETKDSPNALALCHNMGWAYQELRQYGDAKLMCERALQGRLKMFGYQHHQTAETLNNYGNLNIEMGELYVAQGMLERAYQVGKELFGENHPDTLNYMDSVGALYNKQGRYEHAVDILVKALEGRRIIYGNSHFRTCETLLNLGIAREGMGELKLAEECFTLALRAYVDIFGKDYNLAKKATDLLFGVQQKIADSSGSFM